jgi:copper chaperone CopZ
MKLYIKNMVCNRCINAVKSLLEEMNISYSSVQLGEVAIERNLSQKQIAILKEKLAKLGFELLDDVKQKMIEKMKIAGIISPGFFLHCCIKSILI